MESGLELADGSRVTVRQLRADDRSRLVQRAARPLARRAQHRDPDQARRRHARDARPVQDNGPKEQPVSPDRGPTESKNRVRRPSRTRTDAHANARPRSAAAPVTEPEPRRAAPGRGGWDILVTDTPIRSTFLAPAPAAKAAFSLARRPGRVTRRLGGLTAELAATVV